MVKLFGGLLAMIFLSVPLTAVSDDSFDGKKPLICATMEATSCERGEKCEKGLAEEMGAPQFMRIDFAKKEVIGPRRTSPVRMMEMDDVRITLQGFELGLGWTIAIDRSTGHTTVTMAGMDEAFVLFGACTNYP